MGASHGSKGTAVRRSARPSTRCPDDSSRPAQPVPSPSSRLRSCARQPAQVPPHVRGRHGAGRCAAPDLAAPHGPRRREHHGPIHPALDGRHRRRISASKRRDPASLSGARVKLPPDLPSFARRFLRAGVNRRSRLLIYALHRWLDRRRLTLAEFTPAHFQQFLARPGRVRIATNLRFQYGNLLRGYLQWLYDRGHVGFVPESRRRRSLKLPTLACEFLASLAPTHRSSTRHRYGYSLRKLYAWLDARGLEPERLTRSEFAPWFQALHASGLHVASRSHILVDVRAYLHWLSEQRRMRTAPDELIRRTDLPKLPQYLPRPLLPEADRELQRRLNSAEEPSAWALLLMRRTGLRIGELRNLEYHCIRPD